LPWRWRHSCCNRWVEQGFPAGDDPKKASRHLPKLYTLSVHNKPQRSEAHAMEPAFAALSLLTAPAVVSRLKKPLGGAPARRKG